MLQSLLFVLSITIKKATPPKPPSRTRSSFDSVSRRLSHGFELAQYMRQNPIDQGKHAHEYNKQILDG